MKNNSRRKFIKNTALGTAAISIGSSALGAFLPSSNNNIPAQNKTFNTGLLQLPLPYAYDALEDIIDAKTMEIHYSKHAASYSKLLVEAVKEAGLAVTVTTESILEKISTYPTKMRNNAGGHYNHEMFWQSMRPKTANNQPSGKLAAAINSSFGSFNDFKLKFADAGTKRFGSGWAWLIVKDGKLEVSSTPNQDNPLMDVAEVKGSPILGADVWEHAYYLKYQNKRADYLAAFWNVVNWTKVAERFEAA